MDETTESVTKKIINPRVEIDNSPPFESVKEAVDRFGGTGPWIPRHWLHLAANYNDNDFCDVEKIEEQAVQLERDLISKEQETLNVLKEVKVAKKFAEYLKLNLMQEVPLFMSSPVPLSGLISLELNQAKLDLTKMSVDLDVIRGSVDSMNNKMRKEKVLSDRRTNRQMPISDGILSFDENRFKSRNNPDIDQTVKMESGTGISQNLFKELKQMNFEAHQFKKITEASRYEVMRAMAEIERTKNSIKMAEMRLNAARKMEEAAKAMEAIAFAEKSELLNGDNSSDFHKPNGVTLSFEEYHALIQKAQTAEDAIVEKFEQTIENKQSQEVDFKFKFRNSHPSLGHRNPEVPNESESHVKKEKSRSGFRTTSIGSILSRKLILQDDYMLGKHIENHSERRHISLSQMLGQKSRHILHPSKPVDDGNVEKQYFFQRKKFGFIQVPIPKSSKKKTPPSDM